MLSLGLAMGAHAETLHVCTDGCEFTSIQTAIDAASNGDEIVVAAGTWMEAIDLEGKATTLRGAPVPGGTTIETPLDYGTVVRCSSGEGADTVLVDLTITGGSGESVGSWSIPVGGGMVCDQTSPTLINCRFVHNNAQSGGGVFVLEGSPTFSGCTFENNHAYDGFAGGLYNYLGVTNLVGCTFKGNTSGGGGGFFNYPEYDTTLSVKGCHFEGNHALDNEGWFGHAGGMAHRRGLLILEDSTFVANTSTGGGGGLGDASSGGLIIRNCSFIENHADGSGGGVDTSALGPSSVLRSTFASNTAELYGGGMMSACMEMDIANCRFLNNEASTWGGAILVLYAGDFTLVNSVAAGNSDSGQGAVSIHAAGGAIINSAIVDNATGGVFLSTFDGESLAVDNTIVWGNDGDAVTSKSGGELFVRASNVEGGWKGPGNIDLPPGITVDPDGTITMDGDSPCIDAGNDGLLPDDLLDLDGDGNMAEVLPLDMAEGVRVEGISVDIGPIEYLHADCYADIDGDGLVSVADLLSVISFWGPCSGCSEDIDASGTVDVADLLAVIGAWGPCP